MKIKDLCASERPREKMLSQGVSSLSNGELLAVLLRNGTRESSALELAQQLLSSCEGSLCTLFNMSDESMCRIPGIGSGKVCSIMAAFELGKRFLLEESGIVKKPIVSARMVYDMMAPRLKGLKHEECWALFLNDSNYVTGSYRLTSGGGRSTVIDIRQILKKALDKMASGLILLHNHPSGNPTPSKADIEQTDILHKACRSCGIDLTDHIIICDDCFFSFTDEEVFHR